MVNAVYCKAACASSFIAGVTAPGESAEAMHAPGTRGRGRSRPVRIRMPSEQEPESAAAGIPVA
jgi:hypothetical protein